MTTQLAERRKGRALSLLLAAGALAAIAAVTVGIDARSSRPDLQSGPVVPGLHETISGARRITVTSADATYRIEQTERGWAMRDRGDFPVSEARLHAFTQGLEHLRFQRRMTSDPSKHERLGVTDPRQGGRGVLVQVEDGRGALLVNLILGVEPTGLYVRRPDNPQTWAAKGEDLPPLRNVAAWLDLTPVQIQPERIARVEVSPAGSRPYVLARASADAPFAIVQPAVTPLSEGTVQAAAERITHLSPIDVQPAPAIQGAASAHVRVTTFDNVTIDAELIDSDNHTWAKIVAHALAPEQEQAALEINNRAAAWAFALSADEVLAFAPPLTSLVPSPPPSRTQAPPSTPPPATP